MAIVVVVDCGGQIVVALGLGGGGDKARWCGRFITRTGCRRGVGRWRGRFVDLEKVQVLFVYDIMMGNCEV